MAGLPPPAPPWRMRQHGWLTTAAVASDGVVPGSENVFTGPAVIQIGSGSSFFMQMSKERKKL